MNVIVVVIKVRTLGDVAEMTGLWKNMHLKIRRIGYHLVKDRAVILK